MTADSLATEKDLAFEGWDPPSDVVEFLRNVTPVMTAQLARNSTSMAFAGADAEAGGGDDDEEAAACLHSLKVDLVGEDKRPFSCTGVSWSATGSFLAAS